MHHDQRCEVHLGSSPISLVCVGGGGGGFSFANPYSRVSVQRESVSSGASRSTLRARQSRRGSRSRGRAYPLDTCHQSQSQSSAPRFATREEHKRGECSPGLFMDCSCVCVCACVCFCSEGGGRARRTVRGSGGAACGAASERMSALSCTPNPRHSAAARRASAIPLAITSKR